MYDIQLPSERALRIAIRQVLQNNGPMSVAELNRHVAEHLGISEMDCVLNNRGELNPTKSTYYKKMSFIRSKLKNEHLIENENGFWHLVPVNE